MNGDIPKVHFRTLFLESAFHEEYFIGFYDICSLSYITHIEPGENWAKKIKIFHLIHAYWDLYKTKQ